MPRAQMKLHKLHHLKITADHAVRRDAHLSDHLKTNVDWDLTRPEKLLNVWATKLAGAN